MNLVGKKEDFEVDSLIIDTRVSIITKGVELRAGQGTMKRGSAISLDKQGLGVLTSKLDTDNVVFGILSDDIVADKNVVATVYIAGHFNSDDLIFKDGTTLKDYERELRELGIFCSKAK